MSSDLKYHERVAQECSELSQACKAKDTAHVVSESLDVIGLASAAFDWYEHDRVHHGKAVVLGGLRWIIRNRHRPPLFTIEGMIQALMITAINVLKTGGMRDTDFREMIEADVRSNVAEYSRGGERLSEEAFSYLVRTRLPAAAPLPGLPFFEAQPIIRRVKYAADDIHRTTEIKGGAQ